MLEHDCQDCDNEATRLTTDGVWLCEECYEWLVELWLNMSDDFEREDDKQT